MAHFPLSLLDISLEKNKMIIFLIILLHTFAIKNHGLRVSNLEKDIRMEKGVAPSPVQTGLDADNNGLIPVIGDEVHSMGQP